MKIKYKPSDIKKCDKEIKELMIDIINTKRGGTTKGGQKAPDRTLNKDTGNLLRKVKPVISVDKRTGEIELVIEVVEYYQYLDEGTKRIKNPWFLTDELMNRSEFLDSIANLLDKGFTNTILDVVSIKK